MIAASAGNHAQGVALAAQKLGCTATIVMPVTTPQIKVARGARRAARKVVLHGDSYDDAYAHALQLADEARAHVRASLRRSRRDRRAGHDRHGDPAPAHAARSTRSSSPIGGGGLIAGIAAYVKRVRPEIKVIGVEPVDSDAMARSLAAGPARDARRTSACSPTAWR